MLNAQNAMLCWTPNTDQVALVAWPEGVDASRKFERSGLACYPEVRALPFEQRKTAVFIEAMHLIVRDGCEPKAVHAALLGLEEYRDGCAADMPGV